MGVSSVPDKGPLNSSVHVICPIMWKQSHLHHWMYITYCNVTRVGSSHVHRKLCRVNTVNFGHVVFDWAGRQTHITRGCNTSHSSGGEALNVHIHTVHLCYNHSPFKSFINRKLNEKSRPEHIMSANSSDQSTGATTLWDLQDTSPRTMENVGNKLNLAPINFCNWQLFLLGWTLNNE